MIYKDLSTATVTLYDATVADLIEFQKIMRAEDRAECLYGSGNVFEAIPIDELKGLKAIRNSDGDLLSIGAIEKGHVWMMLTDIVNKRKIQFLRYTKSILPKLLEQYEYFGNVVLLENTLHVDWLKYMGAKFEDTEIINNGHKFKKFVFL